MREENYDDESCQTHSRDELDFEAITLHNVRTIEDNSLSHVESKGGGERGNKKTVEREKEIKGEGKVRKKDRDACDGDKK